jgi:hypothetical protein
MGDLRFVSWKEIFLKTTEASDPNKLAQLVAETDLAIFHRQQKRYSCPEHLEELSAMNVASEALRVMKRSLVQPSVLRTLSTDRIRFARFFRSSKIA